MKEELSQGHLTFISRNPPCASLPRRSKALPYTKGEVNRLIDGVLHPLMRGELKAPLVVLDALAHAMVEQDPKRSFRSFARYGLPKLLEGSGKGRTVSGRKRKR